MGFGSKDLQLQAVWKLYRCYYLLTYKQTRRVVYCTIIPIEGYIDLTKKILTHNAHGNMRALIKEGFELLENGGIYFLKYGDEVIEIGDRATSAQELNRIFDKSTNSKAKTALEEWVERARKRKVRTIEILEEVKQGLWKDKDHARKFDFSDDQLESFVEIELNHNTKVRAAIEGEAGDVIGLTGKWKGKSFDAAGLPNNKDAIGAWNRKLGKNLNKFKLSIEGHFDKLSKHPPLDKFVLDLRHIDKYPPKAKEEIMRYLEKNYKNYLDNKEKFEILF